MGIRGNIVTIIGKVGFWCKSLLCKGLYSRGRFSRRKSFDSKGLRQFLTFWLADCYTSNPITSDKTLRVLPFACQTPVTNVAPACHSREYSHLCHSLHWLRLRMFRNGCHLGHRSLRFSNPNRWIDQGSAWRWSWWHNHGKKLKALGEILKGEGNLIPSSGPKWVIRWISMLP